MINPVNCILNTNYMNIKPTTTVKTPLCDNSMQLSGCEAGRAMLVRNNISFKNQEKLVPIDKVYDKQIEDETIDVYYQYESNDKNDTLAYYSAMLLLFLTPPFHAGTDKKNIGNKTYLELKINPTYFDLKTYGECYEKQQPSIQAVHDIYFDVTLGDMKKMDIEIQEEDFQNGIIDEKTKNKNIELINSITIEDVKGYMDKYLLDKKPLVIE